MQGKRVLAIASLTVAAAAPGVAPAHASSASSMVTQMNSVRNAHGLGQLRMAVSMNRSSARWAGYLMRRDWLGHASLQAAHVKGEIIEMHSGTRAGISRALRGWMGSPAHREILLSGRFHTVGVGKSSGRFGSMPATIWVARFR
jgi:uncharacterized protein YkwD